MTNVKLLRASPNAASPMSAAGASPDDLLQLVQWPQLHHPTLIVGHQPTLGRVVARLLGLSEQECSIKKGALWWLHQRERNGVSQTVILTVQSPEFL